MATTLNFGKLFGKSPFKPIKKHMIDNAAELTHTDTDVANKKKFDPRSYLKLAEASMAARVGQACKDLKSEGKTLFGKI